MVGVSKVPPFEECFPPAQEGNGTPGANAMLGRLFSLRSKGVGMTVEKITLH